MLYVYNVSYESTLIVDVEKTINFSVGKGTNVNVTRLSSSFEEHYSLISNVEEYELLRLVGYKRSKIPPHDAVPMRRPALIELILYRLSTLKACYELRMD